MKKISAALFIIITLCNYFAANAQDPTVIRGRVYDKSENTTIVGANIVEYDSQDRIIRGTSSDINGDFVLEVSDPSNSVRVNVMGYETYEIETISTTPMIIELLPSSLVLETVTVTATGTAGGGLLNVQERDRTTSSVKVDFSEISTGGLVSASDALQGRVSGLDIMTASGDPGAGSQIVIRGLSSMGNSQPLVVVDAIPQFRVSQDFDLASADAEDIGNLINVAVQDIKSIEVLKDAGATAIYGSRGADGVLLIETHRGRWGDVQFDYRYQTNINVQPPGMPMLNGDEYIMLQLEQWHNSSGVFEIPPEIAYDRNFSGFYNYSANTDWLGELTQIGNTQDHYFSISGGGDKTRYFTSFGYVNDVGTTINTSAERFSTRINLDYFLSRKLLFQVRFDYFTNNQKGNRQLGGRNVREMAYIKAPNMSIWEHDENGQPNGEYFTPITSYQGDGVTYFNPVAVARLGKNDAQLNRLQNAFMLQYQINDWLVFRETVSFQFQGRKTNDFLPYNAIGADWLQGTINQAGEQNNINQSLRTETQLSFSSPFETDEHSLSGAFSWITDLSSSEWVTTQSSRIPSTQIQDPAVAGHINWMGNATSENRMLSGVGNINYQFRDRYLFQTILRADAHSSFGSDNRWGLFRGLSAGWRFSEEPFMSALDFLGESVLRVSYGVSGRQPGDVYARFATYESTGNYLTHPGLAPESIALSNLRWETITSFDVGLRLSLFNDRVFLEGDVYEKITTDILFGGPRWRRQDWYQIPYSSGFEGLQYFNAGEMTNRGWEIMSHFIVVRNNDWNVSLNFNVAHNKNIFNKLPENFNPERATSIGNGQFPQLVQEGKPIGSFFGFRYLGVWASDEDVVARDADGNILYDAHGNPIPFMYMNSYVFRGGDPIYEDINNDGKIDLNDVVYIGDSNPDFYGGFGSRVSYKRFTFSADFHYRLGFDIINGIAIQTEAMNSRDNQSTAVLSRWRVQGQNEEGMLPRAYMNHPANNLGSDRYVERGDFVRLSNVRVTYQLGRDLSQRLGLRNANFSLSARRLFTFTQYSGQDPEIGQDASNPFWIGVDRARTPPPIVYTFSFGFGF